MNTDDPKLQEEWKKSRVKEFFELCKGKIRKEIDMPEGNQKNM